MNIDSFSRQIKYGKSVSKRIEVACENQDLDLSRILYNYFPLFKVAETKESIKVIIADIENYNPRNNLVIQKLRQNHQKRILKEITPMEIEEGEIRCPKCGGKKVLRTQAQTSSADESFTSYFICVNPTKANCRYKWRVH